MSRFSGASPVVTAEPAATALPDLVDACAWPSEAFWRSFELDVLAGRRFHRPLLELGCGDGSFTALLSIVVDDAVDLNPRAVARAQGRSKTYRAVHCVDIVEFLAKSKEQYATIFANSVLEHVTDIDTVLRACERLLARPGEFVLTVPLVEMNRHLLIRRHWYARLRRRQLQHHNLWSGDEWRRGLLAAGFDEVEAVRYLPGFQCRFWDAIDLVGVVGFGRYRLASGIRLLGSHVLPRRAKLFVKRRVTRRLQRQLAAPDRGDEGCGILLVARKHARAPAEG
jgi:SAM-dependent methyltransferase